MRAWSFVEYPLFEHDPFRMNPRVPRRAVDWNPRQLTESLLVEKLFDRLAYLRILA